MSRLLWRLTLSGTAAFVAAVLVAVVVAVADLYATGHGHPSINRTVFTWERADVYLGMGDMALLLIVCLAAAVTWRVTRALR